ncbi:MAG: hypothetical protein AB7S78_06350 [Candidatus Omnitrophota bacterium]
MTAEITIMNKSAIALAADSAVTVSGTKIYNSANKLFMLSKYHPVGIMIFQNADFMGVPWETIIKMFRKTLDHNKCATVKEYSIKFINFLENNRSLFDAEVQKTVFTQNVEYIFERILKNFIDKHSKLEYESYKIARNNKTLIEDVAQEPILNDVINGEYNRYKNELLSIKNLEHLKDEDLVKNYKDVLKETSDRIFSNTPVNEVLKEKLELIAVNYFLKNNFFERYVNYSGIVIAGFGSEEHFPSYIHFLVDNIFENKLKYGNFEESSLEESGGVVIRFFAQDQMGKFFMRGIEEQLEKKSLFQMYRKFIEFRNESISFLNFDDEAKQNFVDQSETIIKNKINEYRQILNNTIQEDFVTPVLDTVASLPKDELAAMAESLVNLASFKKRVSGEKETVGGPIDVAVISKGDGFVWIKRKHYFNLEFNPHFRENYHMGEDNAN